MMTLCLILVTCECTLLPPRFVLTYVSSVNATARDYSNGFTAFMSYARLILSACSKDQLPVGMSTPLPPRHLASMAIQHYLDYTYTMLPFFEESALHYSIDAVYKTATDPYAGATAFDHWCVRMILGVTNAVLSEQRGDQYYMEAVGHVSVALSHSEQVLTPGSITNIQALLFLVEYAMVDPHHFDSWSLIGAASRAMVDLGLHQDPPKTSPMTRVKLELRRRIYYCVYMLDRSTSIVQTRTFSFSDDSAHVSVPFKDTGSPQASSNAQRWMRGLAPAVDLIKLRKLQSAWYHDLFQSGRETWIDPYAYLWQTYRTMSNWFANISPNYPAPVRSFFELELLYSYVYFLAPSPRVPNPCSYAQSLIFEHCIAYASLMTRLLNGRTHLPPVSFYDAMRVYMTGRQFLDVLSRSQEQLLAGIAPEPPPSGQNAITPPPLTTRSGAAPESNAARSITCIKQITDCLGHFGLRWGYMSWRDNFERVAEPLLNSLHQRRWSQELPNNSMPVAYRQGHLQHLSSGSVPTMDSLSRQSSSSLIQGSQNSGYTPLITGPQIKAAYNQTYGRSPYATESAGAYTTTVPRSSQQSPPMAAFSGPEYQFAAWQGMDGLGQYAGPRHSIQDDNIPPT